MPYDTLAAKDCGRDRFVKVGTDSIFVKKGNLYFQGLFLHPFNHVMDGLVLEINKDTNQFYGGPNYLNKELSEHYSDQQLLDFEIVENRKKMHFIAYRYAQKDTYQFPMCGAGYGWWIDTLNPISIPIEQAKRINGLGYNFNYDKCFCAVDTFMFGNFIDWKTKEELWIGKNFSFVKYRSLKNKHWLDLHIFNTDCGLNIGFTKNMNDEKNTYFLWYAKKTWVIPGYTKEFYGKDRKPQFFNRRQ